MQQRSQRASEQRQCTGARCSHGPLGGGPPPHKTTPQSASLAGHVHVSSAPLAVALFPRRLGPPLLASSADGTAVPLSPHSASPILAMRRQRHQRQREDGAHSTLPMQRSSPTPLPPEPRPIAGGCNLESFPCLGHVFLTPPSLHWLDWMPTCPALRGPPFLPLWKTLSVTSWRGRFPRRWPVSFHLWDSSPCQRRSFTLPSFPPRERRRFQIFANACWH